MARRHLEHAKIRDVGNFAARDWHLAEEIARLKQTPGGGSFRLGKRTCRLSTRARPARRIARAARAGHPWRWNSSVLQTASRLRQAELIQNSMDGETFRFRSTERRRPVAEKPTEPDADVVVEYIPSPLAGYRFTRCGWGASSHILGGAGLDSPREIIGKTRRAICGKHVRVVDVTGLDDDTAEPAAGLRTSGLANVLKARSSSLAEKFGRVLLPQ